MTFEQETAMLLAYLDYIHVFLLKCFEKSTVSLYLYQSYIILFNITINQHDILLLQIFYFQKETKYGR